MKTTNFLFDKVSRIFKHNILSICYRDFTLLIDHKLLIFAFKQKLDKCTPRQFIHLGYFSQYTTNIRHISYEQNLTANILSRVEEINVRKINYIEIAKEQSNGNTLQKLMRGNSNLKLNKVSIPNLTSDVFPSERFRNIHKDIVGPLSQYQSYSYRLTCIDRY